MPSIPATARLGLWVALGLTALACGDDPRVARRASAIDVAGRWDQRRDEAPGASVLIENEADRNDIVVTVTDRVVDVAEGALLARVLDPAGRERLGATLVLGAGRDAVREETDGGENVSFDLGATTTIQVVSPLEAVTPSSPSARDAAMGWSLHLQGTSAGLEGRLEVFVREAQPRPGDVDGFALVSSVVTSVPWVLVPAGAPLP